MCYAFLFLNFAIGFFSDLVLNILSRSSSYSIPAIRALKPYFNHYNSPILPAVYAGLTVLSVLLITIFFSYFLFGFASPLNRKQLYPFLLLSFPIGYLADILIYKLQIFGSSLNPFYKIAGAGFWGAMSFIFAISVAFFLQQIIFSNKLFSF
jgi:hypothetical protein